MRNHRWLGIVLLLLLFSLSAQADTLPIEASCEGLTVKASVSNRWESEGRQFLQLDIAAENRTDAAVRDWYAYVSCDDCIVEQVWNCTAEYTGSRLMITPEGYAAEAAAGSTVTGIGMILSFGAQIETIPEPAETPIPQTEAAAEARIPTAAERLHVEDGRLVDASGSQIRLYGVSTHGLAWFPEYVNYESFRTLRDSFGVNLIRLAMYTQEYGGYCSGGDTEKLKQLVLDGVEYATELGMYVIVDWHTLSDADPNLHADEAEQFWQEMSAALAGHTNVIYEICNEPNGGTSWADIKRYAERIIPVIRENDSEAVILVGTPEWCQRPDTVLADPLDDVNVMYTVHFYAATHKQELRDRTEKAVTAGLPVFISECSICDASGNGSIDYESANAWLALADQYGLSMVCWNLSNKAESSSLLRSDCKALSDWTEDMLSQTGSWYFAAYTRK